MNSLLFFMGVLSAFERRAVAPTKSKKVSSIKFEKSLRF
jgi:hypothetical protein